MSTPNPIQKKYQPTETAAAILAGLEGKPTTASRPQGVAVPPQPKRDKSIEKKAAIDANAVSHWWKVSFPAPSEKPLRVAISPPASYAEVMRHYPDAVAAEPCSLKPRPTDRQLSVEEPRMIVELLAGSGADVIAETLGECQHNADVRAGCLAEARKQIKSS